MSEPQYFSQKAENISSICVSIILLLILVKAIKVFHFGSSQPKKKKKFSVYSLFNKPIAR